MQPCWLSKPPCRSYRAQRQRRQETLACQATSAGQGTRGTQTREKPKEREARKILKPAALEETGVTLRAHPVGTKEAPRIQMRETRSKTLSNECGVALQQPCHYRVAEGTPRSFTKVVIAWYIVAFLCYLHPQGNRQDLFGHFRTQPPSTGGL